MYFTHLLLYFFFSMITTISVLAYFVSFVSTLAALLPISLCVLTLLLVAQPDYIQLVYTTQVSSALRSL